ncbi:RING-H2 finger protein ATL39-like [Telopea speciosissima]|uniref:RING-H2 finger protein ATL39-like n=1 Tax=Telopea speciosissima TaxID=54955 RepID=UPI001CC4380B|nr:RING-H2 finger protein ATL39-like [Telopea speciosissima]
MSNEVLGFVIQIMSMAIAISVILLFVGIVVMVLIHFCIVGRASRRGFRSTSMGGRGSNGGNSMSIEDLKKLPLFEFEVGDKGNAPVDCVVCLESFKMGDKCRLLPICKHSFHAQCVDSWLLKTPICPICRTSADLQKRSVVLIEENSHASEVAIELRTQLGSAASASPLPMIV